MPSLQMIDVAALYLALEELTPHKDELDDGNKRDNWVKKVEAIKPVVERVLGTIEENQDWYGELGLQHAEKCK